MIDAKLPHLEKLLNPELLLQQFKFKLADHLSSHRLMPNRCTIERIHHRKGKRCRVLFRINMNGQFGTTSEQFFIGKMVKPGQATRQFESAQQTGELANGFWPAVQLWEEWDLVIWTFPNDPAMPSLRIAANPGFICSFVSENLSKFGYNLNWRCIDASVTPVKYLPGRRCVLRIHVQLRNQAGAIENLRFYSKTYHDGHALSHYRTLNQMHQQFDEMLNIPRPILFIDQANTFWQEEWPGQPLVSMLEYANWEVLFAHIGELVARMHTTAVKDLPDKFNFITVSRDAIEDAKMLGWLLPQHRDHMENVLDCLLQVQQSLRLQYIPTVTIHGALRLEQFIASGNEVALLDFDSTSCGDPLYDVVELITSLQFMELTHGYSRQMLSRAASAFQESYFRLVPWELNRKRMAWYAASFLLGKMYNSYKRFDRKAIGNFDRALEIQTQWMNILQHKKVPSRRPVRRLTFAGK